MSLVALFLVAVVNVFVMAFQSRNINGGHYVFAACGSIGIGLTQAFVWKAVTTAGLLEALIYSVGGGIGCVLAMWTHHRFIGSKKHG